MGKEKFVYEITAYGADVPEQAIIDLLASIGLRVASQYKDDTLYAVIKKLPQMYPCFAEKCLAYLDYSEDFKDFPESWYSLEISEDLYFGFEDHLRKIRSDSIVDTAGEIRRFLMCNFNPVQAERITADLLAFAYDWMIKEGTKKDG